MPNTVWLLIHADRSVVAVLDDEDAANEAAENDPWLDIQEWEVTSEYRASDA